MGDALTDEKKTDEEEKMAHLGTILSLDVENADAAKTAPRRTMKMPD